MALYYREHFVRLFFFEHFDDPLGLKSWFLSLKAVGCLLTGKVEEPEGIGQKEAQGEAATFLWSLLICFFWRGCFVVVVVVCGQKVIELLLLCILHCATAGELCFYG